MLTFNDRLENFIFAFALGPALLRLVVFLAPLLEVTRVVVQL